MVVYDLNKQLVPSLLQRARPGQHHSPEQTDLGQAREVVLQVEPPYRGHAPGDELPEQLVPAFLPEELPGHGTAHDVVGEGAEQLGHVDGGARGRGRPELGHHKARLLLAGALERAHLPGAQQVGGDELASLPPVLTVEGEGDVGGAAEEDVRDDGRRAGGKDVVVRAQDGLGGARGGDDEVGHLAEVDEHEAVAAGVLPGEVREGDVRVGPTRCRWPMRGSFGGDGGRRRPWSWSCSQLFAGRLAK